LIHDTNRALDVVSEFAIRFPFQSPPWLDLLGTSCCAHLAELTVRRISISSPLREMLRRTSVPGAIAAIVRAKSRQSTSGEPFDRGNGAPSCEFFNIQNGSSRLLIKIKAIGLFEIILL
jgi:hypothetical protein